MADEEREPGPDGVLIERVLGENGDVTVAVKPVGDVRLTEVDTILTLGQAWWRARLGLD